jgi:bifunctional DNA-binding transcriptional regulator/antitoxin component of YhaV-PrlF toxin-antitoxin module
VSTLEVQVRDDGTVLIPAADVASLGVKPGQTLAVELHPKPAHRKGSCGLLKAVLPSLSIEDFRADRAERLEDFEHRRDL